MTSNHREENGRSLVFSSNSFNPSTNPNLHYEPLPAEMLDPELDSDPQISDSELSWQSVTDVDSLTATNHWRGWKQQTILPMTTTTNPNLSLTPTNLSLSLSLSTLTSSPEGLIFWKEIGLVLHCSFFRSNPNTGGFNG